MPSSFPDFHSEGLSLTNPPRPQVEEEVQFEMIDYDVVTGEGEWHIYRLPDDVREYTDWTEFERVALAMLAISPHFSNPFKAAFVLDYLHNTKVVTCNLRTGTMFNPFLEAINERTREKARRGSAAPEGTPDGIIES